MLAALLGLALAVVLWQHPEGTRLTATPVLRWLLAVFLAAVSVVVVQGVRFYILDALFVRTQGHRAPALLHAVVAITSYFVLGLAIAGGVFDRSLTGAIATSAIASVVIGLALQDTLGNFFAGLALQIERPFRFGDIVHVHGLSGRVDSFNWRATTIISVRGSRTVIPNGEMARGAIEVFRRDELNLRVVEIPAPYDAPPQRMASILRRAVIGVPGVAERPAPSVRLDRFDDSSVSYSVLYSVEDYLQVESIDARIRERAWYAFARNDISIPFPHEVQVPFVETPVPDETPTEERTRWLSEVGLFAPLSPDELAQLALRSRVLLYGPGEAIMQTGDVGSSLFVVFRGTVEVLVRDDGRRVRVAELGAGEVIGEMSLLTGEPRSADVQALEEVELIEVRKAALGEILSVNEALAEALALEVSERLSHRADALAAIEMEDMGDATPRSILSRIRSFFDLDRGARSPSSPGQSSGASPK